MNDEEKGVLEEAAVAKKPMASGLKHFAGIGLLSSAYQQVSTFKNRNSHHSSSTTKSSKK
jgi:hypothetical protein